MEVVTDLLLLWEKLFITEIRNGNVKGKKKKRDEGKNEESLFNKPIRDGESP
jgi:hypothetical protein